MFEKLEPSLEFRHWANKWKDKPCDPNSEQKAQHYTAILGMNRQFFLDTNKLSASAFSKITDVDKDLFHRLWEELRESGWRYFATHEGDSPHWYTIYPDKFKVTKREFVPITRADIDDVFIREEP